MTELTPDVIKKVLDDIFSHHSKHGVRKVSFECLSSGQVIVTILYFYLSIEVEDNFLVTFTDNNTGFIWSIV